MITVEKEDLCKHPMIYMWLTFTHEDHDAYEMMLAKEDAKEGDRFRRGYFRIWNRNYLHYKVEYRIEDLERGIISMAPVWLQVFESYPEYEAERVKILQSVPADQQDGFSLN